MLEQVKMWNERRKKWNALEKKWIVDDNDNNNEIPYLFWMRSNDGKFLKQVNTVATSSSFFIEKQSNYMVQYTVKSVALIIFSSTFFFHFYFLNIQFLSLKCVSDPRIIYRNLRKKLFKGYLHFCKIVLIIHWIKKR